MGNKDSSIYKAEQEYIVDGVVVEWDTFKKVCKSRCQDANERVQSLGTWAFGGSPKNQVTSNNHRLKECLLIAKPKPRDKFQTFNVPQFTALGIMGISF